MTDLFNNREIAIGIWIFIFAICASTRKDIRHSFLKLIAASVKIVIMVPALLMIIYNVLVVWSIEILGLWEISQPKDTIVWFIFTGFVTAFNLVNDKKEPHPFKQLIKDNVKFIIVFEFAVNTYTFPLYIELILFPVLVILGGMVALAKIDSKYASTATVTNWLLSLFGTGMIIYVVISVISDYKNFASIGTIHNILLPPMLTILFLPFIYIMMLCFAYENLFFRLKIFLKMSNDLQKYAKKRMMIKCKFNLTKVRNALGENGYLLFDAKSKEDIDRIISEKTFSA